MGGGVKMKNRHRFSRSDTGVNVAVEQKVELVFESETGLTGER